MSATQSSARFRAEREADWQQLEAILRRIERGGARRLSDDELFALPVLYRNALSSLSLARATVLDRALIDYLEALCLRGYLMVYGSRTGTGARIARFMLVDWPAAVRAIWIETLVAFGVLVAATVAGYLLVAAEPAWFEAIVGGMAGGRNPQASAETLRAILYSQNQDQSGLQIFATWLFTHNVEVSLGCFALGFAFGVPTLMLVFANGAMLGAMLEIYTAKGLALPLIGWLSIHGTTELFAITLSAAAGLHIGWRIAFPGRLTRMAAARAAGRIAALVMVGVIIMLGVAGLLEGVGRQVINGDMVRLGIGGMMLFAWLGYFYALRLTRGR